MAKCEHPGKTLLEAHLNGALYALAIATTGGITIFEFMMVLHARFCDRCINEWSKEYSEENLMVAIVEWIDKHPHVLAIKMTEAGQSIESIVDQLRKSKLN